MAEAISIAHTNPEIFYVPDDTALREFKNIFASSLALFEECPSGKGWKHSALFANADDIMNSEEMLKHVLESTKYSVDQQAFLKVRFFDMIINDWDRHLDQWVWAEKKTGKRRLYIPIGRDRDQAFSKTDGFGLFLASRPWSFRAIKKFYC